mgnify:CR=1 FL=1
MKFFLLLIFLFPLGSKASFATDQLRVLTLNTWMIPVKRKKAKVRSKLIGKAIQGYDIALLQEVFTSKVRRLITNSTNRAGFSNRFQKREFLKVNAGVQSFSKYQITKSAFLRFTNCNGGQCLSRKGVLYIQIKLPSGQLLDVFNTHLQAYEKDSEIRKRQLVKAMKFINKYNSQSTPALFAGDFNIIGETQEYDELMNTLIGYQDAWKELKSGEPGYTWNPSVNTWASFDYEESRLHQRLDYIFIKSTSEVQVKVKSINLASNKKKAYRKSDYFLSDHFGVEAILEISSVK